MNYAILEVLLEKQHILRLNFVFPFQQFQMNGDWKLKSCFTFVPPCTYFKVSKSVKIINIQVICLFCQTEPFLIKTFISIDNLLKFRKNKNFVVGAMTKKNPSRYVFFLGEIDKLVNNSLPFLTANKTFFTKK